MNANTTTATPTPTTPITFRAVKVSRGRKFRGSGFMIATLEHEYDYGWRHVPGGDGFYYWERNTGIGCTAKIWVPETGRYAYANADFVEADETVSQTECDSQFKLYCDKIVADTIEWCTAHTSKPGDVKSFARNVIRKNHPELRPLLATLFPDDRDLMTIIESTVKWALTLTTQPCYMYGRHCAGGKRYNNKRYVEIARKALAKKGVTTADGFEAAFNAVLEANHLI